MVVSPLDQTLYTQCVSSTADMETLGRKDGSKQVEQWVVGFESEGLRLGEIFADQSRSSTTNWEDHFLMELLAFKCY